MEAIVQGLRGKSSNRVTSSRTRSTIYPTQSQLAIRLAGQDLQNTRRSDWALQLDMKRDRILKYLEVDIPCFLDPAQRVKPINILARRLQGFKGNSKLGRIAFKIRSVFKIRVDTITAL